MLGFTAMIRNFMGVVMPTSAAYCSTPNKERFDMRVFSKISKCLATKVSNPPALGLYLEYFSLCCFIKSEISKPCYRARQRGLTITGILNGMQTVRE